MQDIFGLADPGQPGTYMNRSKYTENFIQQNATLLPEFLEQRQSALRRGACDEPRVPVPGPG